jgi:HEAT repeat protein
MSDAWRPVQIESAHKHAARAAIPSRITRSLLIGIACVLLLTCLECVACWLVNPFGFAGATLQGLLSTLLLLIHIPLLYLIPFVELVGITWITFISLRLMALRAGLRAIELAAKHYFSLATPLHSFESISPSTITYVTGTADADSTPQELSLTPGELARLQDGAFVLFGDPGSGKTTMLRAYQYFAAQQRAAIGQGRRKLPLYLSLNDYALFREAQRPSVARSAASSPSAEASGNGQALALRASPAGQRTTLLDYLFEGNISGIEPLRPYLGKMLQRGNLVFLCDGLDEVDNSVRGQITTELVGTFLNAGNQMIISCDRLALREQKELVQVLEEGQLDLASVDALSMEQIRQAVEGYINAQGKQWRHTAGQVMQLIDRSRLRYSCPNVLILFALLSVIDEVGIERGLGLDTRGRVLQAYSANLLKQAQARRVDRTETNAAHMAKRSRQAEQAETLALLGQIACAAHWMHSSDAILLSARASDDDTVQAEALQAWLTQHVLPLVGSDAPDQDAPDSAAIGNCLRLAKKASLIEIVPARKQREYGGCILRFRHALLAEYFVAAYLQAHWQAESVAESPFVREILAHIEYWCGPLALLAGLVDEPLQLAEQFAILATQQMSPQSFSAVQALLGSLICCGAAWMPPQAAPQQVQELPEPVADLCVQSIQNRASRETLARLFTDCADTGVPELLCGLFALLAKDGTEAFFPLLEASNVPETLFAYLRDTVELPAYDARVKRLCSVLWQFGEAVVPAASSLSRPEQGRSVRLRTAAVNILGGTQCEEAVAPLIECLSDTDAYFLARVKYALERLGPEISLPLLLQTLEDGASEEDATSIHQSVLDIFDHFLLPPTRSAQVPSAQLAERGTAHYEPILRALLAVLSSRYASEPEVQQQAGHLLVHLGRSEQAQHGQAEAERAGQTQLAETTIALLLRALASTDSEQAHNAAQALQEIGKAALSPLTAELDSQPIEIVVARIIDILKNLRDLSTLPALLRQVGNVSPFVQQCVTEALHTFRPESIDGLIDLVGGANSMHVADEAARILSEMGDAVVEPVMHALFPIVPQRTALLVQVLVHRHDARAVPALIDVLQAVRDEASSQGSGLPLSFVLFSVNVIRSISQFTDQRAVVPLIQTLALPQTLLYDEAIDALSHLGAVAFPGLLAALDIQEETLTTSRLRRAFLGMTPFPAEALISAFLDCTEAQARQIIRILAVQGSEAAHAVVQHLVDEKPRIRRYTQQTVLAMPGSTAVPALLEMLNRPEWQDTVTRLLLKFPEAMPPLVEMLGNPDDAEIAAGILQQFGADVLEPLISAMNDPRMDVQDSAQQILIALADQQKANIARMVRLFSIDLPLRAHEVLLEVLTTDLAGRSITPLLAGLEDAYLINDVSEALMRLSRRSEWQHDVLDGLLASLRMPERRRGTETALIKVGAPAVPGVGALLIDEDQAVAEAAQHVLREIGVPALPYIWAVHQDAAIPRMREIATQIFLAMPTHVIKDAIVRLLDSDEADDTTTALAMLLERVRDEADLPSANQEMVPTLLEYVQVHDKERASLRVLALLFLLGGALVNEHLVRALYDHPAHPEQLAHAFLFLGDHTEETLREMLNDQDATPELRAEAMGMLALLQPTADVFEYAQALNQYGLAPDQSRVALPNQLAISLRALGGLLARGEWDVTTLQNMRTLHQEGSPQHELFSALLGWRFEPGIADLKRSLQAEREARKNEILALTARIVADQDRISELEILLDKLQHDHGIRSDELNRVSQDREHILSRLQEALREKQELQEQIDDLRIDLRRLREAGRHE